MKKNALLIIFISLISCIPLIDFFHPGLPLTHDGQDHVARIANFYQSLSEGIIIPRWAANLNWGYGHPILMFLYPFSSYTASLFHWFGFSLVDSVKLFFAISFIASGITMFIWMREETNDIGAVVSALLYLYAPYRFVDLYVRGAIGEHAAFIFPPLVCFFLKKLSKKPKFSYIIGGSFSFAGLILAHNAISIMFIPLLFLYAVYLYVKIKHEGFNKKLFSSYLLIFFFGFSLSAFFWLPAFFEGKYTLRDIVTTKDYALRFSTIKDFFNTTWSYGGTDQLSKQVGIIQWVFILFAIALLFFNKSTKKRLLLTGLIMAFFLSLFIMTPFSKFIWDHISLLQKFQFPWRFLSITVFTAAVIGGITLSKIERFKWLMLICLTFTLFYINSSYWHAKEFLQKPEAFYYSVYHGTTDTGESSPIWSVRFMEKTAKSPLEILDGNAKTTLVLRSTTIHKYNIDAFTKVRLKENTLFFPGWHVKVDGTEVPVQFQDPAARGIMTFWVEAGKHTVEVAFSETKLRLLSDIISIISLSVLLVMTLFQKKIWRLFQ